MFKTHNRIIAGALSVVLIGQVMLFGDGTRLMKQGSGSQPLSQTDIDIVTATNFNPVVLRS